ncbi:MAG: uroporphyrinogen-III C-methyltransferase [Planctomycetes bacterium]|nr:uroporphyrinogen-III C-methyltransferase [Planctomycetota bacterium]
MPQSAQDERGFISLEELPGLTSKSLLQTPGTVALVGAGPGEPGWITVRGMELLRGAEVVVFDALANPVLLGEAPATAERVNVGKRSKDHKLSQDETNDLLVTKAREGKRVVRLKGGDPYLFGRGAEEVAYLAKHGIACEVVPGITSGIAAPMTAGIPVTHREWASTVTFVTGHEDPTKNETAVDYRALAALISAGGTACIYMGVGRLGAISAELTRHGLKSDTPVAVVQWGATPRQRSVRSTLANAQADVEAAALGAPAIIVVGAVAGVNLPGLDFFTSRPLFGKRIVVTRTRQQASDLRRQLAALGAEVLEAPTIELVEPDAAAWQRVDAALAEVKSFDWLVFTSVNGVEAVADRLFLAGMDTRALAGVKIAAIGDAVADALLSRLRLSADLIPTRFVAESLAGELIAKHGVSGKRVLLLRADIARPALPVLLREAGAEVTELTVYQTRMPAALPEGVLTALRERNVDWITFTSSSTARNMVELLGEEKGLLEGVKLASIGAITSETMRELGLTVEVEATRADVPGLVAAIVGKIKG